MSDKYMNGHGTMRRTRELNDKLWEEMGYAWLGMSVATVGPFLMLGLLYGIVGPDAPLGLIIAHWAGAIAAVLIGVPMSIPYFKTYSAISKHTDAMKAETDKRGRGWADGS